MSNEIKKTYLSAINHVTAASSGTVASGAFSVSGDIATGISNSNHSDYPYADVILWFDFASAPTAGTEVRLYRRDINISGANDEPVPATTRKAKMIGRCILSSETSQYHQIVGVDLTSECEFYIENGTAVQISDWFLTVKPWSYVPAA